MGIVLPIDLPVDVSGDFVRGVSLPLTLPLSLLNQKGERVKKLVPYKETVNLEQYHGTFSIGYKEQANGKICRIPYKETAWFFPGLILEDNILSRNSEVLTLNENIQSLILVDFKLTSTNELSFTWYGNSVPRLTVMYKASADENYIAGNTYSWNATGGKVNIGSDSYDVYLLGADNSGSSAVYTIGQTDTDLVVPEIQVQLNNKFYSGTIDYTSEYRINIDY